MSVKEVNADNFEDVVLKSDKPTLCKFGANWCSPCTSFAPVIEEIAGEVSDRYNVVSVDVDDNPTIAAQYKVKTIPMLIVFKNGVVHKTQIGRTSKENVLKLFED